MRTAGAGEDRVTRLDRKFLAVHLHHAFTAEDVIDLVLFLQVVADGLAGAQRAFSEDLFEAGGLLEETVAGHSPLYTERLQQASVRISMDGKGRALDNILTGRLWRTLKREKKHLLFGVKGDVL